MFLLAAMVLLYCTRQPLNRRARPAPGSACRAAGATPSDLPRGCGCRQPSVPFRRLHGVVGGRGGQALFAPRSQPADHIVQLGEASRLQQAGCQSAATAAVAGDHDRVVGVELFLHLRD